MNFQKVLVQFLQNLRNQLDADADKLNPLINETCIAQSWINPLFARLCSLLQIDQVEQQIPRYVAV